MKPLQTRFSVWLPLLLLVYSGCTFSTGHITPVQDVNASPARFDGKTITLKGVIKDPTRIPVIELKAYTLEDDSGAITILTGAALPPVGAEITVQVRVENLAIIQGEAIGTTLTELKRYE